MIADAAAADETSPAVVRPTYVRASAGPPSARVSLTRSSMCFVSALGYRRGKRGYLHFAKRPFASRHGATFVFTVLFCATATTDFATAFATGAGHLMNLPLASLHRTGFAAAGFAAGALLAAEAVVVRASAAVAAKIVRNISALLLNTPSWGDTQASDRPRTFGGSAINMWQCCPPAKASVFEPFPPLAFLSNADRGFPIRKRAKSLCIHDQSRDCRCSFVESGYDP